MTSLLGSGRRCHFARAAVALASSLDFLQGTFEKIHLQGLLCQKLLQAMDLLAGSRCVRAGPRRLLSWFNHPASCATCTGTSVVPRVLALTHRHLHRSPSVRQPFAEISGSISFSSLWFPFPETVSNFVCHFKGSLQVQDLVRERGSREDC